LKKISHHTIGDQKFLVTNHATIQIFPMPSLQQPKVFYRHKLYDDQNGPNFGCP
jgi:hypothetical protein